MDYSLVFALAIGLFAFIYFAKVYLSRFKLIGEANPARNDGHFNNNWGIYYFYSPQCRSCKKMMPKIEKHREEHAEIIVVDISTNFELAQKFNVRTTPTVFFVEKNTITDVHLGSSAIAAVNDFIQRHEP